MSSYRNNTPTHRNNVVVDNCGCGRPSVNGECIDGPMCKALGKVERVICGHCGDFEDVCDKWASMEDPFTEVGNKSFFG